MRSPHKQDHLDSDILRFVGMEQCVLWIEYISLISNILNESNTKIETVYCRPLLQQFVQRACKIKKLDVQNDFGRQDIYLYPMNSIPFTYK